MPARLLMSGLAEDSDRNDRPTGRFVASAADIRYWGTQSAVSLVDQALTSAGGFGANVLLARWMPAADYGAFVVAFTAYLFLTGFHNALLLEPASVIGPSRHGTHLAAYFQSQLRVHGLLVWPLAALSLAAASLVWKIAPHSPLIGALIGGGLALPLLLLLWLARRMCYVLRSPQIAVAGSLCYFASTVGLLFALRSLHHITPAAALLALGLSSLAGSLIIFRALRLRGEDAADIEAIPLRSVLAENWRYGRWLVGSALFYAVSTSTPTFVVAGLLGLDAAGILRATQIPSLVMTQIIAAIGLLVLPALSYDFGRGDVTSLLRKAIVTSTVLGTLALSFAICLAIFDRPIEHLLFGGKYAGYAALIPLLALIPASNGLCTGFSMALRACQKPQCDSVANGLAALVSLISAFVLIARFGVAGAALSIVLSFFAMNLTSLIFFLQLRNTLKADAATREDTALSDMNGKAVSPSQERETPYAAQSDYV